MSAQFNSALSQAEVNVSPSAQEQLLEIINGEPSAQGIRIFVSGGGCGGMTYGMTYADTTHPYDKVLEGEGYKLMVDAIAVSYLKGCDIDFVENGLNSSFVFNNVFQAVGGSGACGGCGGGGGGGCG